MFRELIFICGVFVIVFSYPSGVPNRVCNLIGTNALIHNVTSQPLNTLPYSFLSSISNYESGSNVEVTISGDTFVGFFVQGRDSHTHEWIGEFLPNQNARLVPVCGAISHADPKGKSEITLTWHAPEHKQGHVYFVGILMKNITTYWSNVISTVA